VIVLATFIAALVRVQRRNDLVALSGTLVLGVVADALLGAVVVYSKLNPYLVALHMMLSLLMVVVGATLYHHSKYVYGANARADVRDPRCRTLARWLWIPFALLLVTGTGATGSGPHAGASQGQLVAKRLPYALSSATLVHSLAALLFIGLVLALMVNVSRAGAPLALKSGVRRLVHISLGQALIGVVQYLTHLPAWLVEIHVAGAVALTIGLTQFNLRQSAREREPGTKKEENAPLNVSLNSLSQ